MAAPTRAWPLPTMERDGRYQQWNGSVLSALAPPPIGMVRSGASTVASRKARRKDEPHSTAPPTACRSSKRFSWPSKIARWAVAPVGQPQCSRQDTKKSFCFKHMWDGGRGMASAMNPRGEWGRGVAATTLVLGSRRKATLFPRQAYCNREIPGRSFAQSPCVFFPVWPQLRSEFRKPVVCKGSLAAFFAAAKPEEPSRDSKRAYSEYIRRNSPRSPKDSGRT